MFQKDLQDLQGLFLESNPRALLAEFSGTQVNFEAPELNDPVLPWPNAFHGRPA